MDGVDADEIEAKLAQRAGAQSFSEDLLGESRTGDSSGASVGDLSLADPTVVKSHRDLKVIWLTPTGASCGTNAVMPEIFDLHPGKVRDDIWRYVTGRVLNLIHQLLDTSGAGETSSGTVYLGEGGAAVSADLGERESKAREAGYVFVAGIGEIASGELPCALKQMTDDGTLPEKIPVGRVPTELVDQGGKEEGRVGGAAGQDYISACGKGCDDRSGSQVGIRGNNAIGDGADRRAGFHKHVVAWHVAQDVIAGDGRDT